MKARRIHLRLSAAALAAILLAAPPLLAQQSVGRVVHRTGSVEGKRADREDFTSLDRSDPVDLNMIVATGAQSNCLMTIYGDKPEDGGAIYMWPETEIKLDTYVRQVVGSTGESVQLRRGLIRVALSERRRDFTVRASEILMVVKGTYLEIRYDPNLDLVVLSVLEGVVTVTRFDIDTHDEVGAVLTVRAGQQLVASGSVLMSEPALEDGTLFQGVVDRPGIEFPSKLYCDLPREACP